MGGTVHIVGAGLAGLGAAVALADAGRAVCVWEGAGHAGGRCRSYDDPQLGLRIDNGNHLVLSGNRAIRRYLELIGATDELTGPAKARFDFFDLASGRRWAIRPGPGVLPWWLFDPARRAPGASVRDHLRALRLATCGADATVEQVLGGTAAFAALWEPLAVGVLNTNAHEAAAQPLWPVLKETFGRGGRACAPRMARRGLSETFVDPALAYLDRKGARVTLNARVRALGTRGARVSQLGVTGAGADVDLGADDHVILAVPPQGAATLVPGLTTPDAYRPILNAHFAVAAAQGHGLIGLTGGLAQWVFTRPGLASVTVSAAEAVIDEAPESLAPRLWSEAAQALALPDRPLPPYRIVKEKRATIAQTPAQTARRPGPETRLENVWLAGDWTATGLPATIEGALRSGVMAAMRASEGLVRWTSF
jgi:squalene-associated FAD-dependent desaturase